ncbi:MAG: hypothetical protein JJE55_06990 [Flavobacteriaceae bacterium]|nr:hypothetical protein [Flavobacteriaceae bacterium]
MKQAIALLETEIATRKAAVQTEWQAISDLQEIVKDLQRINNTSPVVCCDEPNAEVDETPTTTEVYPVVDVFNDSRLSRDGKNKIPSDKEVLEAMKIIDAEETAGAITKQLLKSSDLPIQTHSVIVALDRLAFKGLAFKDGSARPFTWSLKPIDAPQPKPLEKILKNHKPKKNEPQKGYSDKLKFAESKGFKNVAEAIATLGPNTFKHEFKNSDFLGRL